MIETLHVRARIRAQLQAGSLGPYVDGFVDGLLRAGYARGVVRRYVHAIERFARWLRSRRIPPARIDERVVARFVAQCGRTVTRARPGGRLPTLASGVRTFARVLWAQGSARQQPAATTEAARWLIAFDQHLTTVHGLARGTRRIYLRYARALLANQRGRSAPLWAGLTADDVTEFVRAQASRLAPATCRMPVTATRAILRFLTLTGAGRPGLDAAVPTIRQWKHATLPRYLTRAQVDTVLAPSDAPTVVTRRNHAIVVLLAHLGLRAGEVAALGLDDIDWRAGRVRIRAGKSRRERDLPLPTDVGTALVAYLRARGPAPGVRAVFLRGHAPVGAIAPATVTAIAQQALARAGVTSVRAGAHAFRHTVATHLVRGGASFKAVADVLGHAQLQTTALYAKLDVDALAGVALPWPGGAS
jgi:site-specific recombinase XerD